MSGTRQGRKAVNPVVARDATIHVLGREARVRVFVELGVFEVRDVQMIDGLDEQKKAIEALARQIAGGVPLGDLLYRAECMQFTLRGLLAARTATYDASGVGVPSPDE